MADYRLYCLDDAGDISLAEWIEAETDEDAIAQAQELKPSALKCEVWKGNRLLAVFGASLMLRDPVHSPSSASMRSASITAP